LKLSGNTNTKIQTIRGWIQIGFLILTIWIGIEFYLFVSQLEQGIVPAFQRPPGVEAFLPISALISFKYWMLSGVVNTIHPAALVLLLIFVVVSVFLKKGFCSWICPFGWLSEMLTKIHIKIFDRQLAVPRWLDYPLRSLKYLLLFFFVYAVFFQMDEAALRDFIYSPYNRVADIKMLHFFTRMSEMTFWILVLLVLFSLAIPYFWCRYLCPYGGLLGALSWLSPYKISRNRTTCIDCEKCTKVCPALIKVHTAKRVFSDECHGCLHCVDICPVKNTLYLSAAGQRFKLSGRGYAIILVVIFLTGVLLANLLGIWNNSIDKDEYLYHIKNINGPAYHHNRGDVSEYDRARWQPDNDDKNE